MKRLRVNSNKWYEIFIENGILEQSGDYIRKVSNAKKVCLISDTNVYPIYKDIVINSLIKNGFDVVTYIFKAGEESKTMQTVISILEFMSQNELTREDIVLALGGGVCGDMAGFAAAIYLRGIEFIQIPTSLLAQVDSSVRRKDSSRFTRR